jgi:hypothetical protein
VVTVTDEYIVKRTVNVTFSPDVMELFEGVTDVITSESGEHVSYPEHEGGDM